MVLSSLSPPSPRRLSTVALIWLVVMSGDARDMPDTREGCCEKLRQDAVRALLVGWAGP